MTTFTKVIVWMVVIAAVWFGALKGWAKYREMKSKAPAPVTIPTRSKVPAHQFATQDEMEAAGFTEHPANLHVTVRNVGDSEIRSVWVGIGKQSGGKWTLEPSGEADATMHMYMALAPLVIRFKDAQDVEHERFFKDVYRLMPKVMKGNFNVLLEVNGATGDVSLSAVPEGDVIKASD